MIFLLDVDYQTAHKRIIGRRNDDIDMDKDTYDFLRKRYLFSHTNQHILGGLPPIYLIDAKASPITIVDLVLTKIRAIEYEYQPR